MWSTLIGAGLNAAASLYGSYKSGQSAARSEANLRDRMKENEAWFDRRYNEDATARADAQRILRRTEESMRSRNRDAASTAAVMGGTQESVAGTKAANGQAMAEAASAIAAGAEARKDRAEEQYLQRKQALEAGHDQLQWQKAQNVLGAAQGVAKFGTGLFGSFDSDDAKD